MYNGVKIAYNAFDSIISELDDYEILAVRIREGCTNGQGYKRFAIIYDIDKIREIKHYFEKILSNEFVKLIEEELKEVKKGTAAAYFNNLSMKRKECIKLLRNV